MGGDEEEGARLFSVMSCDRTRGNGHKWKYKKFHLSIRKSLFYCDGDRTLKWVAQRSCGACILGDIQNPTGHGPGQPAVVHPALNKGFRLGDLQSLTSALHFGVLIVLCSSIASPAAALGGAGRLPPSQHFLALGQQKIHHGANQADHQRRLPVLGHRVAPWSCCLQKKGELSQAAAPDQELRADAELP
ncbi:hypothetical protein QYF61_004671, partial [Mycteria americana]